ncbi:unnamed protein product [Mesocestoides corti]|uniref:Ig-like domain-containing protein n=2 Tax=Mesocestoides corti TaxID=53468 RepID=A0A0R3UPQ2_MESCO|nr:unnamed protein product [Mesocestoides corti]
MRFKFWGAILIIADLTCFAKKEEGYTFDGPFTHEALVGSLVELPCYVSSSAKRIVLTAFTSSGAYMYALKWVHRRWERVVDPWGGDGRRSYLEMSVSQTSDGIAESLGIFNIPSISGVGLRVLAVNPSDGGQYACVLSRPSWDQGLSVDMDNSTLLSIHSLRIIEAKDFVNEMAPVIPTLARAEDEAEPEKKSEMGSNTNNEKKGTFFDAWTWQLYSFIKDAPEVDIFKIDCYADIPLVGLVLRGLGNPLPRIGWKFVPRESSPWFNVSPEHETWDVLAPVQLCPHERAEKCSSGSGTDSKNRLEHLSQHWESKSHKVTNNLDSAFRMATERVWMARWLLVKSSATFGSGTWQCWIEGPNLFKNTSTDVFSSTKDQFLVSEVRVFVVAQEHLTWHNTVEFWRVLVTWAAPTCFLLFYLLVAVSWAASMRWTQLLYYSSPISKKKTPTLIQKTESDHQEEAKVCPYDFEERIYTKEFLSQHKIRVYFDEELQF